MLMEKTANAKIEYVPHSNENIVVQRLNAVSLPK